MVFLPKTNTRSCCIPRASGGVSVISFLARSIGLYSPRKRGCFQVVLEVLNNETVFPAQAGVFPIVVDLTEDCFGIPRASGGVSAKHTVERQKRAYSPRKRGCFLKRVYIKALKRVFPAQAGVFPLTRLRSSPRTSIPRASGGVSRKSRRIPSGAPYSPRKRGCFQVKAFRLADNKVFPAQAGVFPSRLHGG